MRHEKRPSRSLSRASLRAGHVRGKLPPARRSLEAEPSNGSMGDPQVTVDFWGSGELTVCYWTWWLMGDFRIEGWDFWYQSVKLPEGKLMSRRISKYTPRGFLFRYGGSPSSLVALWQSHLETDDLGIPPSQETQKIMWFSWVGDGSPSHYGLWHPKMFRKSQSIIKKTS